MKTKITIVWLLVVLTCFAWGPRSHIEIVRRSGFDLSNDIFPQMSSFHGANLGALCSGAIFPDWALGVIGPTWSYHAHSMAFADMYLEILLDSFPDFSSPGAQRELAFLMGINSHIYADRVWHGYHDPPGMTSALEEAIDHDGIEEDPIEAALDIIIAYEYIEPSFSWFWPEATLLKVYHAFGDTDVTEGDLNTGFLGLEALYSTVLTGSGYFTYISSKALIPWTYDNYVDYYPGGFDHTIEMTISHWRRVWAKGVLNAEVYQRSEYECGYTDTYDAHLLSNYPGNNTGGEDRILAGKSDTNARALLKWNISDFDTASHVIDSAFVFLKYYSGFSSGTKTIEAYKVNRNWGEGTSRDGSNTTFNGSTAASGACCWTHAEYSASPWGTPGADGTPEDRSSDVLYSRAFAASTPINKWYSWDISSAAWDWTNSPSDNHGIILREVPGGASGEMLFNSGENTAVSERPVLVLFTSGRVLSTWESEMLPNNYTLFAYPNPFNSAVTIILDCGSETARRAVEHVEIFDMNGRRVLDSQSESAKPSSTTEAALPPSSTFNSSVCRWQPDETLGSGVYLVRASIGEETVTKRVVYLK